MPFGQNQKTAVIGHQFKSIVLMAKIPSDPAVSWCTFQSGSRKTDKRNPIAIQHRFIPEGFADLGKSAQIMMQLHQMLKALLFTRADYLNTNFLNVQDFKSRIGLITVTVYTPSEGF